MIALPTDSKNILFHNIAEMSWEKCPWSEEILASKKIYTGYNPRGSSDMWNKRRRITDLSLKAMFSYVAADHSRSPLHVRRKWTKLQVEEVGRCVKHV